MVKNRKPWLPLLLLCSILLASLSADRVYASETEDKSLSYAEKRRLPDEDGTNMLGLKRALERHLADYDGEWSVYVKALGEEKELLLNGQAMVPASLIKVFVMEATYSNMEKVLENQAALLNVAPDSEAAANKIRTLLENMVTYSDNESYNELVRLQTASHQFKEGAKAINRYLWKEGYEETLVKHTLAPSPSEPEGIGESNISSVRDCGLLLERIYRKECVSKEASEEMLSLLLRQDTRTKIPQGLHEGVQVANKTGENDLCQHDIAIVYGEKTDYVLCVMSQGCKSEDEAVRNIQRISSLAYHYLN